MLMMKEEVILQVIHLFQSWNQERRLRSRSYLSLSWTKNDWAAGVSTQRIGSMNYQSRWDGKW